MVKYYTYKNVKNEFQNIPEEIDYEIIETDKTIVITTDHPYTHGIIIDKENKTFKYEVLGG